MVESRAKIPNKFQKKSENSRRIHKIPKNPPKNSRRKIPEQFSFVYLDLTHCVDYTVLDYY
jgi:hypothetical protein